MADEKLVKLVQGTFSMYGLTLSRKLGVSLAKELLKVNEDERKPWLVQIVEQILTQDLNDPHITVESLKLAIEECIKPDTLKNTELIINVIDAFEIPKIKYDLSRKKFVLSSETPDLYAEAQYKSTMIKDRFESLWYRTLRHEYFTPPKLGERKETWIELVPIECLLSGSKQGDVYVMGFLTHLVEGQFYLEDTGGTIKIDLTKANFQDGLILEASVVIVSGNYKDDVLYVEDIGLPPAESSSNARADFGDSNTFGGLHKLSLKMSEKLQNYEKKNKDGMMIFVSEMWLDSKKVLKKFRIMLEGYSDYPPIAFVLCGHFLSFSASAECMQKLEDGLKELANIITQYPKIKESSKFIFVPASDDIGAPKILPRYSFPKNITEEFKKSIPGSVFTSNPCRIQYCTKEIVVLREDILTKMCRNALLYPKGNIYDHYAKTIICQSHLTPLNPSIVPTYWKHDYALQIYPTPDLIVSADRCEAYATTYSNCHVINPGSFPKNDYAFKVYVPGLNLVEHCAIPDDMNDINE